MTSSQFKAKYAGSILGFWWAVITPIILAASINLIFTAVFQVKIPNYTLFVLSAMIPWIFFSNALTEATNSFLANASLLKQGRFLREFIPISSILGNLLNFFVGFIFLLPLFIVFNFKIILFIPLLIVVIILHSIFLIGLGVLFSSLNVFIRDLNHFLSVGMMIWFWVTPVFYSFDMIPFPFKWICIINPVSHYIVLYRSILYEGKVPGFMSLVLVLFISLLSFFIGYILFLKKESIGSREYKE